MGVLPQLQIMIVGSKLRTTESVRLLSNTSFKMSYKGKTNFGLNYLCVAPIEITAFKMCMDLDAD